VSGGTGALLVFLFNVVWGFYAQAGGVEVSEFCLLLVVFSCQVYLQHLSKSYFRKHAFCILPVVAILESPLFLHICNVFFFLYSSQCEFLITLNS
jgi:hypothetical protein